VIWLRNLAFLIACGAAFGAQAQIAFRGANSATAAAPSVITHVGAGGATSRNNCGSVAPTIPGGNVGDLLIATVVSRESGATLTFPGTWTLLYSDVYPGQDFKVYIYYRFATGADGFSVQQTANCQSLGAQVARFRGVDPVLPFYNVPIPAGNVVRQNSNNVDTGTEASAGATDMMVVVSFVMDNRTVTQGAGWSQSFDSSLNLSRDAGTALHYRLGGASSIANWALQGGGNDSNYGIIFALRPAGALTINVPAGTALDDVMIASVTVRPCSATSGAACTVTVGTPAGWTLIRSVDQTTGGGTGGFGNRLLVYQRVAGAAEPASYTWSIAGAPSHAGAAGAILGFSGVDTASPIVAEAGQATASSFNHAAPGIDTGTQINTVLVSSHSANSAASWTPPAGMTERVDIASIPPPDALGLGLEVNTQDFPLPGATGTRTATHSNPPAQDTGATHVLALRPLPAVLHWSMDQSSWNGTAGEVLDSSGNGLHGTAMSGANTASTTPAIAGNPGTCQYGSFDGIDDFVQTADNALLDVTDELTVMAWVRPTAYPGAGLLKTIVSKDQNYEFHLNSAGRINWWWGGAPLELTSAGVVPLNAWTHVAIVYSRSGAFQRIYINGAQDANTNNQSGALVPNNMPFQVGSDQGFAGRQFAGLIDEVRVYRAALSTSAIQTLRNQTRPCAASINHFSISHAGSGVACSDQTITITSHDASHTAVDAGGVSINLSTSNGRGTWTGILAGGGLLSDPTAGDGAATYTFAAGSSQVSLLFRYANVTSASETFSFNAVSGGLSEASGTANASDDPSFTMAQAGFVFSSIPTQLSGKPSNTGFNAAAITIQAVDTDAGTGSCTTLFASQNRTIQLGAECNNPSACAGQSVSVNGANVLTTNDNGIAGAGNYGDVALAFDAASQASLVLSYPAAGQMSLHARYDLNPAVIGYEMIGSSNAYVVRPFGLRIDGVPSTAPGTGVAVFKKAGENFNVQMTAVQWELADDVNGDGVPDSDAAMALNAPALNFGLENVPVSASLTHTLSAPAGGAAGTLGGSTSFGSFVNGSKTQAVNWSEVGFINLFVTVNDYLGAGNVTNSAAGLTGAGRFSPDHFFITNATLTNRIATACASTFTYMNEGIGLAFTLQARNASNAITQNYTSASGYAKLDPGAIAQLALGALGVAPGGASVNLTARIDPALGSAGSFAAGSAAVTATVPIRRNAAPDGPYSNVRIGIAPVDSDTVALRPADLNLDVDGAAGNDHAQIDVATSLRFGRLRLDNAVGSEKLDLPIGMRAEYWSGGAFVTNADDGCTSIAPGNIAFSNYQGGINAGNLNAANLSGLGGVFSAGVGNFTLLKPSGAVASPGSVDICVDLGADSTPPPTCTAAPAGRSYLQGRVSGANYDDDPVARAAFGLFGAQPNNFIYFRENF
jgi:MSHA biogenesis protein MshQ